MHTQLTGHWNVNITGMHWTKNNHSSLWSSDYSNRIFSEFINWTLYWRFSIIFTGYFISGVIEKLSPLHHVDGSIQQAHNSWKFEFKRAIQAIQKTKTMWSLPYQSVYMQNNNTVQYRTHMWNGRRIDTRYAKLATIPSILIL